MRRLGGLLALTAVACLLQSDSSAGESAEWWYTGSWDNGRFLHFIDAGTVKRPTTAYAPFSALAYYNTPWIQTNTPTGEGAVAYEKFIGAFDCRDHNLHGQRFLFNAEELLFAIERQDPFAFVESSLVDSEYAFVCLGERAGGSHDFRRIFEDPVTYSRRQRGK